MEFSVTERGAAKKLLRNGYQYVKRKDLVDGMTSWECIYQYVKQKDLDGMTS